MILMKCSGIQGGQLSSSETYSKCNGTWNSIITFIKTFTRDPNWSSETKILKRWVLEKKKVIFGPTMHTQSPDESTDIIYTYSVSI